MAEISYRHICGRPKIDFFFWGGEEGGKGEENICKSRFPPPLFFFSSLRRLSPWHEKGRYFYPVQQIFPPLSFFFFYLGVTFELYQKFRGERCEAALDLFLLFPRFSVLSPSLARRGFRKKYFSSFAKAIFNDEANLANRKRKKNHFSVSPRAIKQQLPELTQHLQKP